MVVEERMAEKFLLLRTANQCDRKMRTINPYLNLSIEELEEGSYENRRNVLSSIAFHEFWH
jgi:hypothetical protein